MLGVYLNTEENLQLPHHLCQVLVTSKKVLDLRSSMCIFCWDLDKGLGLGRSCEFV